jgi:hypothetical protein
MSYPELHVMNTVFIKDRQTMRYTCPVCQRCVEDGTDGITIIHKGDPSASHRGGSIALVQQEVEQPPKAKPVLH